MTFVSADRVRESSTSPGTSDFSLNGAITDFLAFSSVMSNGDTCFYTGQITGGGGWEIGIGTKATGVLQRTTVLASSNSGSLVNFTGTVDVFMDIPSYLMTLLFGATSTATAAGTTTLTNASAGTQIFTGTTTQTVKLPTTGVLQGQEYKFINNSTGIVTVQSSAGNTIQAMAPNSSAFFTANVATPTTAGHWNATPAIATTAQFLANVAGLVLTTDQVWAAGPEVPLTAGSSATVTFTNGSSSIAWTGAPAVGSPVHFTTTGSLPTNFSTGTEFYILTNSGGNVTVGLSRTGAAVVAGSAGSGTQTGVARVLIDGSKGIAFSLTMSRNETLALPYNFNPFQAIRVRFVQPSSGGPYTLSVPAGSGYKYIGTSAPTLLSTAANAEDILTLDPIAANNVTIYPGNARTAW